jgi:phage-related minor tail protein
MIKANRGSAELEGTFHQLLAELVTVVQALQAKMDEESKIQELFKHKSVMELLNETMEIYKQMKTSGLSSEDFLKTLSKK